MKSEYKTAIMMLAIVGGIVGIVAVTLNQLDTAPSGFEPAVTTTENGTITVTIDKSRYKMAPGVLGIAEYINTSPEELEAAMEGKVVMYDIWTYSCINCVRTLPYITAWNDKYADEGLLIIGVHSPEFEFEKDPANVRAAVQKHGITYPVVMDNDWETWQAFENRYWPRKYVTDHEGYIRYDHIGEGGYKETERIVQELLAERAEALGMQTAAASDLVDIQPFEHTRNRTPELYFGYKLALPGRDNLGNEQGFRPGDEVGYSLPTSLARHKFYLEGAWLNTPEYMGLVSDTGRIVLPYAAKEVNIVVAGKAELEILLDGELLDGPLAGRHVEGGTAIVDGPALLNLVSGERSEEHIIEIRSYEPGLEMYTFTFG